jgi:SAM-dependent methyltransferase
MDEHQPTGGAQAALWNGPAGRAWVETQDLLDQVLKPFERMLVDAVQAAGAHNVLDVGCGTGATTLAIAQALGPSGRALGVDISQPMIAMARDRGRSQQAGASFLCADAQEHAFAPGRFDMVVSRFGVMFFEDPVRAFANLRRAATPGARMFCLAWRGPQENPFMTTAERAAAPLLPALPPRRPDGPGQFGLADRARAEGILADAGWRNIELAPVDVECSFAARELERYATSMGPVGLLLQDAGEALRRRVTEAVRDAFARFVHGEEVRFTAACWVLRAIVH